MSSRTRKYRKDLRPHFPGRRAAGVRGVMSLVFERSSAGEEIRVILFCAFLAFLAVCGIVADGTSRSRMGAPAAISDDLSLVNL